MFRLTLLLGGVLLVGACSSTQTTSYYTPQYCYTNSTTVLQNETVSSSETLVQCTDRPGQQMEIARAGIDKGCEEFWFVETRWNKPVNVKGVRCEKLDGTWEILNINGTVR